LSSKVFLTVHRVPPPGSAPDAEVPPLPVSVNEVPMTVQ
jgi:hypothetical protein